MIRQSKRETIDPSPDEIRAMCQAIRERWTDHERVRRSSEKPVSWMPPMLESTQLPTFDDYESN